MIKISTSSTIPHNEALNNDNDMPSVSFECIIPNAANVDKALGVFIKALYLDGYCLISIQRALELMAESEDIIEHVNSFLY